MQRTCHKTIVIHPHTGQFVINELPTLVLCGTVWVYGGMEGLPLTAIATVIALILSLLLLYRYLYLRRIRYCVCTEQRVSEYGIIRRKVIIWSYIVSWIFKSTKACCNNFVG